MHSGEKCENFFQNSSNLKKISIIWPLANIADVLYKTTFLENWGSGIMRIVDACNEQGVPEPIWESRQGFVVVTFPRPSIKKQSAVATKKTTEKDYGSNVHASENAIDSTTEKTTEKTAEKTAEKIISIIRKNPTVTNEQIAQMCNITADGVYYHIKQLKANGSIRRVGGRKEGRWVIIEK